jgi:hypothetical protein
MDNLQKESSDIFLTSPIIINSNSRNFLENNKRRNLLFSKNYLSPIKHQLIQKNIFHNSILEEKKTEKVPLLNSYFTPENFQQYTKSCNKYHHKIDHVIKDILSPKSILLRNRRYDEKENNLISDMNKDEIIHRSAGQGMFFRIQKYKSLNKKKRPFQIIFNNTENKCDNDRYIKKKKIDFQQNYNFERNEIKEYNNIEKNNEDINDIFYSPLRNNNYIKNNRNNYQKEYKTMWDNIPSYNFNESNGL